jgi:hypothetical protein
VVPLAAAELATAEAGKSDMNRTVPNAKNWPEKKKRGGLRAIDKGTSNYDVTGRLRRLVHQIESGKHGEVTDVVLAIRSINDGRTGVKPMYLGTSQLEVLHFMACVIAKDIL